MSLDGKHVAVIGAGIGGAATALLAARAGARVTLLEREVEPRAIGTGILLHPNALAVLYGLDLDERLLRRGARVSSLRVADASGRTILAATVPRFAEGLDHALVLRRSDLLSALIDLVAAEAGVDRRFGCEVREASPDGEVTYRGPAGSGHLVADVVVGADGVHSAVRHHSGLGVRVGHGLRYLRGLASEVPLDGMTEYWTRLGIFGVAPVPHGCYFYCSAQAKPLAEALAEQDLAYLRRTWEAELPLAGRVLGGIAGLAELVASDVFRVDCERWANGRIVLVGDAAHAMAPNLGQGSGSALADAVVLVRELAQPGDVGAALARYESRRRPRVRAVQDVADWLGWLSEITSPVLRSMRDAAVRLVGSWVAGELGMRLVEQQDPLWLRMAARNPAEALEA
jgi:2-polyprenyl-6-methoxyphenol hydroxylase-like FAD-dependent oxidoreductase